ncbi:hypothetical protein F442_00153 [Phytophthora nicotianae P10297]|uniref:Uncharacterized protein n=4 Tax=Phytophthora nicotianae TaxID=4792 RepID=W3A7V9_PHYNI|nr:hypothetical protein F442_00153 [Phytophthora nicotianae P10297]
MSAKCLFTASPLETETLHLKSSEKRSLEFDAFSYTTLFQTDEEEFGGISGAATMKESTEAKHSRIRQVLPNLSATSHMNDNYSRFVELAASADGAQTTKDSTQLARANG